MRNSGHFNVELDLEGLGKIATNIRREVRDYVDEYTLPNGNRIFVLAEGRLVNLACAEGHPASVMDMSFATQALASEWVINNKDQLKHEVYEVSAEIVDWIARLKLETMGIDIDTLTPEQQEYLSSWEHGT